MDNRCPSPTSFYNEKIDLPDLPSIDSFPSNLPSSSSSVPTSSVTTSENNKTKVPSCRKYQERPTECAVCGKAANGYHYEVPSCNGCKTFFRRILVSEKNFECHANKDCFDLSKREFPIKCRACRYLKCINLGMNPEAMKIDEVEAQAKNFKKLSSSKRVVKVELEDDDVEIIEIKPGPSKSTALAKPVVSSDEKMEKLVDMLSYLELKVEQFRKCAYNPPLDTLPGLEALLNERSQIFIAEREGPMKGWPLEQPTWPPPKNECHLAEAKGTLRKNPIPYEPKQKSWFLYDLLTTVEYAKTFMFFHRLDMKDRVLLLKYVGLACMNLHISHFSVQRHYDRPVQPDGVMPPLVYGMVYSQSVMSISPLIRYDVSQKEYILLKAICLCNPAVPGLSHHAQEIIASERKNYASVLFEHCIRDSKLGPSHFAHLIGILDTLEHQQKIQKDLHTLVMLPITKKWCPMRLIEDIMEN